MRSQGVAEEVVDAVATNRLADAKLDEKQKSLLEFVKVLTLNPSSTKDEHVEAMRRAGWKDDEIWEAALETSLFAFLNRMADAFGLDYPASGWLPPEQRKAVAAERTGEGRQEPERR